MRNLPKILRTRMSEPEMNVVANLAERDECTAGQLIRRLVRDHAMKVPNKERRKLTRKPTTGMRATILRLRAKKKRRGKR